MSERKRLVSEAIRSFQGQVIPEHQPDAAIMLCCDSGEHGGGNFDFGDAQVFRLGAEIAAVIPPYKNAPVNVRAKFSFSKLKDIGLILIQGHSECGGAQTVTMFPCAEHAPNNEIGDIVESVGTIGADLPRLVSAFKKACEGDGHHAANLLSRHLTLVSLQNVLGYPFVHERVSDNQLDLIPTYHNMQRGTGRASFLERYDVSHMRWGHINEDFVPNMCARPHECTRCNDCNDTMSRSLEWVDDVAIGEDGKMERIELPYHISAFLRNHRAVYQPQMHKYISEKFPASVEFKFVMSGC